MDNRGKRQAASLFGGMGFYIALLVCVIAAGVVGYYALLSEEEDPSTSDIPSQTVDNINDDSSVTPVNAPENGETQQVLSQEPVVVQSVIKPDIPEDDQTVETGSSEPENEVPVSGEASVPDNREEEPEQTAPVSAKIVSPISGITVAVFSADKLMYDATLDDWRTHDGIDISAEAGTQVVAAAAGTVIS